MPAIIKHLTRRCLWKKNLMGFSKLSFFSSAAGRVDFVCFQAFRPNKVPFYNFFIAGRSALKKKRCSNQCNSRPISTTGCQQMCRDDDKTSPKKRGMLTRSPIFQPNLFLIWATKTPCSKLFRCIETVTSFKGCFMC